VVVTTCAALAYGGSVALLAEGALASPGLAVTDLAHGSSATALAQSLAGTGVSISNIQYTGTPNAAGTFTGGADVVGFDSGIILGTGSVQTTRTDPCSKGVEGPNQCDANTTDNGGPGDPDLDALSGVTTYDAAVLNFDFVPVAGQIQFSYVFSSDEYPEFANTPYNDTFAFFVNGKNCALVPGTALPVSVNTINGGNPLGTDPQNPQYYVDNHFNGSAPSAVNTEMDGLTIVLTCSASVSAGQTNHMKLAIADGSDGILDSNVFLKADSLTSGTQVATTLSGNGQSGPSITVPAGTAVTDTATLTGDNVSQAGGTVTYAAYTDTACTQGAVPAGTKPVTDGVAQPSDPLTLAPGTWYWQASYSGDALNNPVTGGCDEVLTVTAVKVSPTLTTTPSPSVPVGGTVSDTATLTGGNHPTGTVTFSLFGADDPDCLATPLVSSVATVGPDATATSDGVRVNAAGTYHWSASYSGDDANNPASSSCDSESVEVTPQVLTGRAYALAANLYLLGQSAVLIPKTVDTRQVSTTQSTTVAPQCASSPSSKLLCANVTTDAAHARSTATATLLQLALTVPNWPALPAIELKAVQATSTTSCAGSAGAVTIAYLKVGSTVLISVPTTVRPNTRLSAGAATVVLNEQLPFSTPDRGLTVNAVHVSVGSRALAGADVVLGSAESDIGNCP
jgi:hypothetical protein